MSQSKTKYYWENLFFTGLRFLWFSLSELYYGITEDKINVSRYLYPGLLVAALLVVRLDLALAWLMGLDAIRLPDVMREWLVYTSLCAGFFIWAGERAFYRARVLSRLREAFLYCGLSANRKFPGFIEDVPIDEHVRKLKIFANGVPLKKFMENRENLEAHLNISTVRMYEELNDKSRINIVYAMKGLQELVHLENQEFFVNGDLPIGTTFGGDICVNLCDVGHILVAGQTGQGKSNFLKVATSVLTLNNPEAEVYFLDFKGGMELADLVNRLGTGQSNFFHKEGPSNCVIQLGQIGSSIETRLNTLAAVGATTFDDYLKKYSAKSVTGTEATRADKLKRQFVVIDEIAQLYSRDPGISRENLLKARDAVNRIARQGRAAGVHLIVATQRPDATSFDQTVKANLPAVLCFPMVSQAASVSALGTKRAFDLNPEIKGRAVWKYGPQVTEVQTYVFE